MVLLGVSSAVVCASELVGSTYLRGLHGRLTIGDNVIAREYGVRAAKMLPHDVRVFRWLSRLGVIEGDVELVEESVRTRLKIHPHLLDALADRATVHRRLGNRDRAELRYRELLARAPNFVSAWGDLGAIYFEKEEYELAVEAFSHAVEIQDSNAMWHHNLASAYGILKRYREALAADERAIERDPGFTDAYVGVALSARALGEMDRARAAARQAYTLAPDDPRALRLLQKLQ